MKIRYLNAAVLVVLALLASAGFAYIGHLTGFPWPHLIVPSLAAGFCLIAGVIADFKVQALVSARIAHWHWIPRKFVVGLSGLFAYWLVAVVPFLLALATTAMFIRLFTP